MLASHHHQMPDGTYGVSTKTPGRALLRSRSGLQENAISTRPGPKNASVQSALKQVITIQHNVPLVDKTPFPNRVGAHAKTPLPNATKFPRLSLLVPNETLPGNTPESILRPSSLRRNSRVLRNVSKSFETPITTGNHWDVSDVSICTPESQASKEDEEIDYDEVEYMPPKQPELPYEPPFEFELPNYKELGTKLLDLTRSYPIIDNSGPDMTLDNVDLVPISTQLPLPHLEDDDLVLILPMATSSTTRPRPVPVPVPTSRTRAASTMSATMSRTRLNSKPSPAPTLTSTSTIGHKPPSKPATTKPATTRTTAISAVPPSKTRSANAATFSGIRRPTTGSQIARPGQPGPKIGVKKAVTSKPGAASVRQTDPRPGTSASVHRSVAGVKLPPTSKVIPKAIMGGGHQRVAATKVEKDNGGTLLFNSNLEAEMEDFLFDV